ncbi:hypothetical protein QFC21_003962 [Naganishia friedmannii]|uniref:Uncharacterized protein n=1 Tax=Naganishia friedmannii TaxID=89922 RepID=A0ACC2VKL6_9TREE|nr:hypothetical protein QFC21_003962 [Naganishia friedmannii]
MPYRAFSTPPETIHASNGAARHLPDHAYSPLFTTAILNSSHAYGYDNGRFPTHLTFHQQTHQTPRKPPSNKSGLPSPLSSSSASPSMKKKQSSVSLARSLNSSQSGSIRTPSKLVATEKESRGTSKPKIEWWRARSSSYVANQERTSEEKSTGSRGGWLRQSDVWMAPEVSAGEGNTNDSSLGHARSRPLPGLPSPKEHVEARPQEVPTIKKKASFGPFKFKNFFQSNKGKDASGIPKHREQLAVLASSNRGNQPSQQYSRTGSLPNRYDQRSTFHSHTQSSRPVLRPPPICTSFPRGNGFSSPYAPTSTYDSSPIGNVLPYMAGAGDGWNTPFLPYPPAVPQAHRTNYNTEFPFPVVPSHLVEDDPMEQLVVQDDAVRKGRVTSVAFEYQEFETDIRNSAHLDSSVSSKENAERYVDDDLESSADTHALSLRKSQSDNDEKDRTTSSSKRESRVLPLSPPPLQSREPNQRPPVVETVKPLSIGRNYPRARSTVFADVHSTAGSMRSTQPQPWDTQRYVYSDTSGRTPVEEDSKDNRLAWNMSRQFSDLALDSLDDTDSRGYDSLRW